MKFLAASAAEGHTPGAKARWKRRLFSAWLKPCPDESCPDDAPRQVFKQLLGNCFRRSLLAGFVLGGQGLLRAQEASPSALPPGKGKDLVAAACTQCHGLRPILQMRDGAQGWRNFVDEMVLRGAQLSPEEAETVIQYLAGNLGPGQNPMGSGNASSGTGGAAKVALPPGAGKELIESRCTVCHDLGRVITAKRSKADWELVTKNMAERGGTMSPAEMQAIVSYLSSQFGKPNE